MDIILDMVGGEYLNKNIALLKEEGRLIYINSAHINSPLSLFKMMQKRIQITGSTLRNRSIEFKSKLIEEISNKAIPLIDEKGVQAKIYKSFHFSEVQEAHKQMESGDFMGKIILDFEK